MATIRSNGCDLYFEIHGAGLPCLVMHGGFGFDHTGFRPHLDALGDELQLVYYDHRGNGRSGRPPAETLTMAQIVDDAEALRRALGFSQVLLVGSSVGGLVAAEYALRFPDAVGGLVFANSLLEPKDIGPLLWQAAVDRRLGDEVLTTLQTLAPANGAEMAAAVRKLAGLFFTGDPAAKAEVFLQNMICEPLPFSLTGSIMAQSTAGSRLHEITAPALYVFGEDDCEVSRQEADAWVSRMPRAQLAALSGAGHLPFVDQPGRFVAEVRAWLRNLKAFTR